MKVAVVRPLSGRYRKLFMSTATLANGGRNGSQRVDPDGRQAVAAEGYCHSCPRDPLQIVPLRVTR
jgi:hypothetical protein